jgi:hypothetical protein
MGFINRSELNELFPVTIYMKIGSYISSPLDIVHTRLVSFFFKEFVSESACRTFLDSHASIIERSGFYPSTKSAYENFKECILFLQYRESKHILQKYPVYPHQPSFVLIRRISRVFHEELETVVENQVSLNLKARELFSNLVFPFLSNSHPVFRVMTMQRDEESRAECHNRVWRWLLSKPEEIKAIYSIFHLNIQPNVPSCRLLSFIPFEITRFSHLQELTLDGHLLTEVPVFLRRLQSLRTLNLQNNHITDVYCPFREMTSLTKVNLTNNCLTSFPSKDLFHPNRPMILIIDPPVVLYADKPESVFCDFNVAKLNPSEDNILPAAQAVQDNLTLLQKIAPSSALEKLMQYFQSRATPEDFLDKLNAIQDRASELIRQYLFPKPLAVQTPH